MSEALHGLILSGLEQLPRNVRVGPLPDLALGLSDLGHLAPLEPEDWEGSLALRWSVIMALRRLIREGVLIRRAGEEGEEIHICDGPILMRAGEDGEGEKEEDEEGEEALEKGQDVVLEEAE